MLSFQFDTVEKQTKNAWVFDTMDILLFQKRIISHYDGGKLAIGYCKRPIFPVLHWQNNDKCI